MLTAIGIDEAARREYQYRNHIFDEKHREYGLQAADLLAWTLTKAILGGQPRGLQPYARPLMRLAHVGSAQWHVLSFTGEKLQKFFAHQINGQSSVIANVGPRKRAFR